MNAKEARELANNSKTNVSTLAATRLSIKSAAKKGEYKCWVYHHLSETVRDILISEGFAIGEEQQDRDGILTEITW